jgi:hypothetical protein
MPIAALRRLARVGTLPAVLGIIVLSWLPGSERPQTGAPGQFEHFLAYALTAAGIMLGFPMRRVAIILGLVLLAGGLEIAQLWIDGRQARAIDFIASAGGAVIGAHIVHLLLNRRLAS